MGSSSKQIFISYVREDHESATRLYRDLLTCGYRAWLDSENLTGGTEWRRAIPAEIRRSELFIALLSTRSLDKRGFAQAELRQALEVLQEVPPGRVFIIPARLDDCEVNDQRLADIHRVDLFPIYQLGLERLLRDIRVHVGEASKEQPTGHGAAVAQEKVALLREFLELAGRLATDGTALLTLRKQDPEPARILGGPIRDRVQRDATRLIALTQQVSLLCTPSLVKAAGNVTSVAFLLKAGLLSPAALDKFESQITTLISDGIPRFRLLARQEMGLLG